MPLQKIYVIYSKWQNMFTAALQKYKSDTENKYGNIRPQHVANNKHARILRKLLGLPLPVQRSDYV
ncbi:hypothetical protein PVAP13_3KG125106 [Panicum virgatum]|uniref:Uncharacterized protein n=1 Tax=Panicum virgatum TaxID=38727 RepID=A0A8T0V364_PANVG|nr:hypothetical protein PVAP13_3KG125106 [Panicum virgatum]